jgi:hypothetical protein
MKRFLIVIISAVALTGTVEAGSPAGPFESEADPTPQGRIDELVHARLKQLGFGERPGSDRHFAL